MIYGLFLLLFMNNVKLNMPLKNGYFCAFSVNMLWGKCESSRFTDCNKYRQLKISYLAQVQSFQMTFLEANDCEGWWRGENSYKAAVFIKISLNQSIFRMDVGGGIRNHYQFTLQKKVAADQEKTTKLNKKQIKPKQKKAKIEIKITSKNKDEKNVF